LGNGTKAKSTFFKRTTLVDKYRKTCEKLPLNSLPVLSCFFSKKVADTLIDTEIGIIQELIIE